MTKTKTPAGTVAPVVQPTTQPAPEVVNADPKPTVEVVNADPKTSFEVVDIAGNVVGIADSIEDAQAVVDDHRAAGRGSSSVREAVAKEPEAVEEPAGE